MKRQVLRRSWAIPLPLPKQYWPFKFYQNHCLCYINILIYQYVYKYGRVYVLFLGVQETIVRCVSIHNGSTVDDSNCKDVHLVPVERRVCNDINCPQR